MDCSRPGFPVLHYLPEFLKHMSTESMMPSNHLNLCHPLLLLPSVFLSIRLFSYELALCIIWPKYWSFSFSISPSNESSGLIPLGLTCLYAALVHGSIIYSILGVKAGTQRRLSTKVLVLLNCGAGEDSWSPFGSKEIKSVSSKRDPFWIFIGRTDAEAEASILWPRDVNS